MLLSRHLFFEEHAGLGFRERQLMHLLLIGHRMAQGASQGLAIQGHVPMLFLFRLSRQAAVFLRASLGRQHPDEELAENLGHLLRKHRS